VDLPNLEQVRAAFEGRFRAPETAIQTLMVLCHANAVHHGCPRPLKLTGQTTRQTATYLSFQGGQSNWRTLSCASSTRQLASISRLPKRSSPR